MEPLESGSGSETLIGSLNRDPGPGGKNYPQKRKLKKFRDLEELGGFSCLEVSPLA